MCFDVAVTILVISRLIEVELTAQTSQPPALTLAQITQAASGDAFERLISKTITWSYAVLTPPYVYVLIVLKEETVIKADHWLAD